MLWDVLNNDSIRVIYEVKIQNSSIRIVIPQL
jgi:hypothetical protein